MEAERCLITFDSSGSYPGGSCLGGQRREPGTAVRREPSLPGPAPLNAASGHVLLQQWKGELQSVGRGIVESRSLKMVCSSADPGRGFTPAAGSRPKPGAQWICLPGEGQRKGVTAALGEVPPRLERSLRSSNRLRVPALSSRAPSSGKYRQNSRVVNYRDLTLAGRCRGGVRFVCSSGRHGRNRPCYFPHFSFPSLPLSRLFHGG